MASIVFHRHGAILEPMSLNPNDLVESNMITDAVHSPVRSSSSDPDESSNHALVVVEREDKGSRLRSMILLTTYLVATVGWLWFLISGALWLIDY